MPAINHHSSAVLPYHLDRDGKLHFVLEQKDPNYKRPFFDNGLNFLGGNWKKGKQIDVSPEETLGREIKEEFWQSYEAPESLNALLGQGFLETEPQVCAHYDQVSVNRLKSVSQLLQKGIKHVADYTITVREPIADLVYNSTIFSRKLDEEELFEIKLLLNYFNGRLTTDNLKWGSKTTLVSLDEINEKGIKFSWGYDNIVNDLLERGALPKQNQGVIRPLKLISLEGIEYPAKAERTKSGNPTYNGFEDMGFVYKD